MPSTNAIEFDSVSVRPPGSERDSISDLALTIEKGEVVILRAEANACTELIRLLTGSTLTSTGVVRVNGTDPRGLRGSARHQYLRTIGIVSNALPLLGDRSVFANAALPLELDGDLSGSARHRVEQVLRSLGLADRASSVLDTLSPSERQRCQFARALAREPRLLLLDDPTIALSEEHVRDFAAIIERERLRGMTILITTSDPRLERSLPHVRLLSATTDSSVVAL